MNPREGECTIAISVYYKNEDGAPNHGFQTWISKKYRENMGQIR